MLEQHRVAEAIGCYRTAVHCSPDSGAARFHLAFALLLAGEFAEGWREYEWRFALQGMQRIATSGTEWDGADLTDRTILVRDEQGFGDALQFTRFAQVLQSRGARVVVECHAALARLLATCPGVDAIVTLGSDRPDFDLHVWRQSLPGLLGVTNESIPARVSYLSVDQESLARWRPRFAETASFRIGIAWQGDPGHANDRKRSFSLLQFAPLARLPGVRMYSLQVGASGREQLSHVQNAWPIVDLAAELTDFYETAAAMHHLDLVITCDSSPAHLAGALGRPVWVALPFAPDWRWQLSRSDSPWYPSMRLFRQPRPGDWDGLFHEIETALAEMLRKRGSGQGRHG
jgi:hypothetical protein